MDNEEIEGGDDDFSPQSGRKYRPVNDRSVVEMSSLDPSASSSFPSSFPDRETHLRKVKVSSLENMDSDAREGLPPAVSVNGSQRESKLELFGFDSLVTILGLKRMTGEQAPTPSSPRDGEDVSITLGRPKLIW